MYGNAWNWLRARWEKDQGRLKMQGGAQENLWPKSILVRPVARHFVCDRCMHMLCRSVSRSKHRRAICELL